jgi:hypothetical protein
MFTFIYISVREQSSDIRRTLAFVIVYEIASRIGFIQKRYILVQSQMVKGRQNQNLVIWYESHFAKIDKLEMNLWNLKQTFYLWQNN